MHIGRKKAEDIEYPILEMTKQDVYLIKYLFNQGELKIKICDFIKVKKN